MSDSPLTLVTDKPCANCGALDVQEYCAACGQRNVDLHAPLKDLIGEAIEDAVGLDSRIRHTLKPFLFKPGFLTRQFAAGKRAHFTSPFKLYIATSAAYFVLSSSMLAASPPTPLTVKFGAEESGVELGSNPAKPATPADAAVLENLKQRGHLGRRLANQMERLSSHDPAEKAAATATFEAASAAALPKATFALLPVFALLMWLVQRRKDHFYIDHLVFALHLHAFFFAISTIGLPLPGHAGTEIATVLAVIYAFRADRFVYGDSFLWATLKLSLVAFLYSLAVALAIVALALVEVLTY